MEKITKAQSVAIDRLIRNIECAVKDEDPNMVIQALTFMLFGYVKTKYELSERETVEFCAKHIKIYAQTVFS